MKPGCILALDILFFKSGSWDGVMEWIVFFLEVHTPTIFNK